MLCIVQHNQNDCTPSDMLCVVYLYIVYVHKTVKSIRNVSLRVKSNGYVYAMAI